MALADLEPPRVSALEELRRERDTLRRRLGDGRPNPSWEYRRLSEEYAREQSYRDGAQWRLDTARKQLADLGPIDRRTHRRHRRELEDRIAGFEADIARHDERVADLEGQLQCFAPSMMARIDWEREHRGDLDRTAALDRQIDFSQRLERAASRGLERGVERGLGIEL